MEPFPDRRWTFPWIRSTLPDKGKSLPYIRQIFPNDRKSTPDIRPAVPISRKPLRNIRQAFQDIRNWIPDIRNPIPDIEKCLADISGPCLYVRKWPFDGCNRVQTARLVKFRCRWTGTFFRYAFRMDDWVERELSQLAADGGRLMPAIYRAARLCGRAAAWDKPRSGQNAGLAHDVGQWRKSDAGGREVLSADFADAADEEKEICAICVICGSPIPHSAIRIPHLNGSFPVFILEWTNVGKAVEGHRSPKPGGNEERPAEREASWSAPALWRFGTRQLPNPMRLTAIASA